MGIDSQAIFSSFRFFIHKTKPCSCKKNPHIFIPNFLYFVIYLFKSSTKIFHNKLLFFNQCGSCYGKCSRDQIPGDQNWCFLGDQKYDDEIKPIFKSFSAFNLLKTLVATRMIMRSKVCKFINYG